MGRVDLLSRNVGRGIDVDSRKLPIYVNTYITAGGSTLKVFRSADLQKQVGKVLSDADIEPVVVHSRDVPRSVILSRDEFVRLKDIAGEAWPEELAYPIKVLFIAARNPILWAMTHRMWTHMSKRSRMMRSQELAPTPSKTKPDGYASRWGGDGVYLSRW